MKPVVSRIVVVIIIIMENEKLYFMISIVAHFLREAEPIIAFRRKQLLSHWSRSHLLSRLLNHSQPFLLFSTRANRSVS